MERPKMSTEETQMNIRESLRWQVLAAECGIAFEILFTIFWGFFAHNLPPAAPSLTGPQLVTHFAAHREAILFGNSMAALVAVLWIPWTAQLTVVMRRIEGANPVLTIIQLSGGILTAWVLMFCPAIWATAVFRTDLEPNTIRALNDLGFILFNITYAVTSVQAIAAGVAGLVDKNERRVFPRWVCYWAIFTGFSFVVLTAMPFYTTGPIAWNGAISFWGLFGAYFVWTGTMGYCMIRDARRRLREEAGQAPSPRAAA
jgi:hypothetical protein